MGLYASGRSRGRGRSRGGGWKLYKGEKLRGPQKTLVFGDVMWPYVIGY
jgi:hypothetical protein